MFTATVTNGRGESLRLFPSSDYAVEIDGLTPPKATLNFSVVATNDGSIYNSGRLENRNIVLTIKPLRDVEINRQRLYRFFQLKKACKFQYKNANREVYAEGIVEAVDGSLFELSQSIQVSIICPQPYFKALKERASNISQIVPLFEFPFSIDSEGIPFSSIERNTERNVFNGGDVETGVRIELRASGEVSDPIFYDSENGVFGIDIDMIKGDLITINTNRGEKSVTLFRDGEYTNIINLVYQNPKWFTLQPGDNLFSYTASDLKNLQIVFIHSDNFEGV